MYILLHSNMVSPWSLPFVAIFLSSSVSSYNTTVIKFDDTDQYSAAEGCAMEFADRLFSEFKSTHSCSPEDAFSVSVRMLQHLHYLEMTYGTYT